MTTNQVNTFQSLNLSPALLDVLAQLDFKEPTSVQAQAIPLMQSGADVIVQSQTGTGKTAAFSLPIIETLDPKSRKTQCLVLAPTRELAIQVTEAIRAFCKHHNNLFVSAIYGGSEYRQQIKDLRKGSQIVVGTPGRVMDHIRRGTLHLDSISHLVLDEADEMLRMGFIDDVEWILSHTPEQKQMALFSATMPAPIKKIAQKYLMDAKEIHIKQKTLTVDRIKQHYAIVKDGDKFEAIQRLLEMNEYDGVIIFARTKIDTQEIAERLIKAGLKAEALNGDLAQATRKRCIDKLKSGKINIIVATDVAARGIDIERVSCVINADIPFDHETYVHRIGRTGRAGRQGEAILLVSPKQRRLLKNLERTINTSLEKLLLPSSKDLSAKRLAIFEQKIQSLSEKLDLTAYKTWLAEFVSNNDLDLLEVTATIAHLQQGGKSLLNQRESKSINAEFFGSGTDKKRPIFERRRSNRNERFDTPRSRSRNKSNDNSVEAGMARYRLNIGSNDGVKPGNIVGAIANEANLNSRAIGRVSINRKYSLIDLPSDLPAKALKLIKKSKILGKPIQLSKEMI